jgi:baseplate J-like protein
MKDTCGCCEGTEILVQAVIGNRPGLNALQYRIGTHGSFLESMKARLSSSQYPSLQSLTTREGYDPSIALLDSWASVADVLTFYQERIANEGYLRTATERRSILELARLIGYRLRPGVSASVFLAFTIEDGFDAEIPRGTRANSMAGQGESSQPFETSELLKARSVWNTLKPRLTQPQFFTSDTVNNEAPTPMYLEGTTTNLKTNSPLLLTYIRLNSETQALEFSRQLYRTLEAVTNQEAKHTKIFVQLWNPETDSGSEFPVPDTDAVVAEIVKRYVDLKEFGLSPTGGIAFNQAVPLLTSSDEAKPGLKEKLLLVTDDVQELGIVKETIVQLQGIFENLDVRTRRLREWLSGLIADLTTVQDVLMMVIQVYQDILEAGTDQEKFEMVTAALEKLNKIRDDRNEQADAIHEWLSNQIIELENVQEVETLLMEAYEQSSKVSDPAEKRRILLDAKEKINQAGSTLNLQRQLLAKWFEALRTALQEKIDATGLMAAPTRAIGAGLATGVLMGSLPFQAIAFVPPIFFPPIVIKPPAVPLPNPQQLPRDAFRIFSPRSDMISRMLFTFNGSDGVAVQAWANSTVPEPEPTMETGILKSVEALRVTAALFGHDAPPQPDRGENQEITGYIEPTIANSWNDLVEGIGDLNLVALDKEYDQIKPGSWIVINRYLPSTSENQYKLFHCQVVKVETRSLGIVGTAISATILTLTNIAEENNAGTALNGWISLTNLSDLDSSLALRNTRVYAQTEPLPLAEVPISEPIQGNVIELAELYDGLEPGRWLIISGERADIEDEFGNVISGIVASERVILDQVIQDVQHVDDQTDLPGDHPHTFLQISPSLSYKYKPETVKIYANVVKATHGETLSETFGSGDGSQVFQKFELRQTPLTYVAAPTPDGIESSLVVRVNDVQWHEARSLADLDSRDRGYVTRIDDDGKTSLIFGNGKNGARPPTGIENIKGKYRRGIGKSGNVKTEQIKLLATKPLHVKSVINPLRASGGADPESRDQARKNAPLAVTGFDRLVSVKDYEDFARKFAGIGKSSAMQLSDGRREIVHLTIAGADDIPIDESSDLYLNLRRSLQKFGDPYQPVVVVLRSLSLLVISAKVQLLADYAWEFVEPTIRAAMLDAFSFERRELGQDVTSSEVVSVIQGVEGISYVDLETLDAVDDQRLKNFLERNGEQVDRKNGEPELVQRLNLRLNPRLRPELARFDPQTRRVLPAQIAYLDPNLPDTLILTERQA